MVTGVLEAGQRQQRSGDCTCMAVARARRTDRPRQNLDLESLPHVEVPVFARLLNERARSFHRSRFH